MPTECKYLYYLTYCFERMRRIYVIKKWMYVFSRSKQLTRIHQLWTFISWEICRYYFMKIFYNNTFVACDFYSTDTITLTCQPVLEYCHPNNIMYWGAVPPSQEWRNEDSNLFGKISILLSCIFGGYGLDDDLWDENWNIRLCNIELYFAVYVELLTLGNTILAMARRAIIINCVIVEYLCTLWDLKRMIFLHIIAAWPAVGIGISIFVFFLCYKAAPADQPLEGRRSSSLMDQMSQHQKGCLCVVVL